MNDSDFETSGIRKMIIKITGIDIFKIEYYEPGTRDENGHQQLILHFTCASFQKRTFQTVMIQAEFNNLCALDLASFQAHFERIALDA